MVRNSNETCRKLARLANALADEIDTLSDEEIIHEVQADYGNVAQFAADIKASISKVVSDHGKQRLFVARAAFNASQFNRQSKIVSLPIDKKRALLQKLARANNSFGEKITLAARNETTSEKDVDSLLLDLVALGLVDDEGNLK